MTSLAKMSDAELHAENERLMAEKAKALAPIRAKQRDIARELDARHTLDAITSTMGAVTPDARERVMAAVRDAMTEEASDG